jgi:RNA polymerase sigma factor (sigma-70 family)
VTVDDVGLRELVPEVLSVLVRRGADFATAEDAVQEALVRALSAWRKQPPSDRQAWLITVAWRVFIDAARSDGARRDRETRFEAEPSAAVPRVDDTLQLFFLCAHSELSPSSAVALTLRAVGGLTTRQIAQAYLVPESTMAQRISRAKRTVRRSGLDRLGDIRTVMKVLYLIFNEGYSGDIDLAGEAIRLTRQLAGLANDPEIHGLLALMLLHHARRSSRTGPDGRLVPLSEQDRSQWDTHLIAEGVSIVHAALARDQLGEYQAQAAIAALHADAARFEETDWVQIVEWYDELRRFADTPIVRLNRAVAVGHADGPLAGLAALAEVEEHTPRREAVAAHLHERNGDLELAARLYAEAARNAPNVAERDHQTRQQRGSTSVCVTHTDNRTRHERHPQPAECFALMRSSTACGIVASKSRSLTQVGVIVMTTISS